MSKHNIVFKIAKDGNLTCKVESEGKVKYLYSKYRPKELKHTYEIEKYKENAIILGLGLGYELQNIEFKTDKKNYVIDKDRTFYNAILRDKNAEHIIINSKAHFIFRDEYNNL